MGQRLQDYEECLHCSLDNSYGSGKQNIQRSHISQMSQLVAFSVSDRIVDAVSRFIKPRIEFSVLSETRQSGEHEVEYLKELHDAILKSSNGPGNSLKRPDTLEGTTATFTSLRARPYRYLVVI